MKFIVLVKATPQSEAGVMPSHQALADMGRFNESLVKAGVLLAGEGLHPSSRGTRVTLSDGKATVENGPFADTAGLVSGFWLLQLKSREEAVEWMKRCPNPNLDGRPFELEIRKVFEAEDFGDAFTPELREAEEAMRRKVEGR